MSSASMAVLGAALSGAPAGLLLLTVDDFVEPNEPLLAAAMLDMLRRGEPVDPITVTAKLAGRVSAVDVSQLAAAGVTVPAIAEYHAGIVRAEHQHRYAVAVLSEALGTLNRVGLTDDLPEMVESVRIDLSLSPESVTDERALVPSMRELMKQDFPTEWLIPGLLARPERTVVVAGEGVGKSVLLSQVAVAVAGGCHPFSGGRIGDPGKVLWIDAENSPAQTKRRFQWIGRRFPMADPSWPDNIHPHIRPEGLDLKGKDRGWLSKVCAQVSPDLIVITPAYKVMDGDPKDDGDTLALFRAFDEVRVRHNAAMLIETHAGHAKSSDGERIIRPYGSSVWLRWPEVGLGIARSIIAGQVIDSEFEVGGWRGSREERMWPDLISRGTKSEVPWTPARSDYFYESERWRELEDDK